jgi:hypothetical protein
MSSLIDAVAKPGRAHGECHESIGLRRKLGQKLRPQVLDQLAHRLGDGFDVLEVENFLVDAFNETRGGRYFLPNSCLSPSFD